MQLFFIGNRPKVLDRWSKLLSDWRPKVLSLPEFPTELMLGECVVLVHLNSVTSEESKELLSLKKNNSGLILIACTDAPNEEEGLGILRAGANGYTNTYITGSLLLEVLKTVVRGDIWAGPELLQRLLRRLLQDTPVNTENDLSDADSIFSVLSKREHEVLNVLTEGKSNKEIARSLDITERTVKAHLSSIFQKTGVQDRVSLVLLMNRQAA